VIESVLHLLKIHRKVILGNPAVIVQDMLRKTPESLNAVDMIFGTLVNHAFRVAHGMMLAQALQGIITSERVRVVDAPFPRLLADDRHQFFFGYMLHHPRIHLAIALQKPKYDVFASSAPPALAFASAAEVALVHLHLAIQFAAFKFCDMIDHFSELLIDAGNRLVVEAEVMREAICRLLLIEPLHDCDFRSDAFQGFLLSTPSVSASDVSAVRLRDLERTAENALSTPQKVGRTTENVLLSSNHKGILTPCGYETH